MRLFVIAVTTLLSAAPAQAEIVEAWCSLIWRDGRGDRARSLHFRQAFGNVQVQMGERWAFDFPAEGQGRYYTRRNRNISSALNGAATSSRCSREGRLSRG